MSRARVRDSTPREHPLTEAVRQLAAEVRVLRQAVDELVTEIQWQNQNRPDRDEGRGCPFAVPVRETAVMPAEMVEPSPKIGDSPPSASSATRRVDGRLF